MLAERAWTKGDVKRIGGAVRTWWCTPLAAVKALVYENVSSFCRVTLAEIEAAEYALTLGRYLGANAVEDDGEPIEENIGRPKTELLAVFDESPPLVKLARHQWERIDV